MLVYNCLFHELILNNWGRLLLNDMYALFLLVDKLGVRLMNDWLVHFMNYVLVSLMNDRLMNLVHLLLIDNRLVYFMNDRLVMLMNYVLVMLMHHVLMMFMYYIAMCLLYDDRLRFCHDLWCHCMRLKEGLLHMPLQNRGLVMSHDSCRGDHRLNKHIL
jgi:hypothetical protein